MSTDSPPTAPIAPTVPGTVLAGKYRVERIIGQGGMGVVVEARHIALDERVALKFLLPDYASHREASERFLREARAAVKIKSAHVARVSDVGTLDSGAPYMVMEFLEGSDAGQLLEKQGVLPLQDAVDFTVQACEAIAEAHSYNIVHRDLKPANLFVTRHQDGSPLVKVLDFGISKVMGGGMDNLTKTTAAMGSALYMSPEQMQSTRSVDHRTDIYALGVSLYELLAGKQPYYADTLPQLCAEILTGTPTPLRSLRPDLPDAFAGVVEKAYARDRAQRFQTIAEFVIALAPFAPPRSQPIVDRIARMAGMSPPVAGAAPAAGPGGTQVLGRGSDPLIVPGHYNAPSSSKAAAAFATANAGGVTDLSATGNGVARPQRGPGLLIGAGAMSAVVIAAIIGVIVMKSGDSTSPAAPEDTSVASAVPPPTPEPSAAGTADPTATADPSPTPPPASASATEPASDPKPGAKPLPGKPKPAPTPTATAKPAAAPAPPPQPAPQPTPKKPNAFDDR